MDHGIIPEHFRETPVEIFCMPKRWAYHRSFKGPLPSTFPAHLKIISR